MFYTFCFTSPKAFPKIFKIFFRTFYISSTLTFSLFETCSCQRFLLPQFLLLLYTSLLLKMNSHFNLDFSKLLHFWFTNPPMLVHNSLIQHAFNLHLAKDFHADYFMFINIFSNKPMADTKKGT